MENFIIDGKYFETKEKAYKYMKSVFEFPEYFGNNLDALWDLLDEMENYKVDILNARCIPEYLEDYGLKILDVFGDLQEREDIEINIFW